MRIRIQFTKNGPMRFVGHLDFVRTLQKIFRKSNIPIAFSEGYSPRPIFSIAAPLAVGVSGEGEYLDLELAQDVPLDELMKTINACCPDGLMMTGAVEIDKKEPAAMGIVSASSYRVTTKPEQFTAEQIEAFLNQEAIVIKKMTKSGKYKDMDLRPGIFEMNWEQDGIYVTVATGSTFNIRPEMVLEALCGFVEVQYNHFDYKVHRKELYYGEAPHTPLSVPVGKTEVVNG